MRIHHSQRGSTIVELLIVVLVVGTVLTAIAASLTFSVQNTAQGNYREFATSLALEPIEYLRYYRADVGWTAFAANMTSRGVTSSGKTFCVNQQAITDVEAHIVDPGAGSCSAVAFTGTNEIGQSFTREVEIVEDAGAYEIRSTVRWIQGGSTRDVLVVQKLFNF